MIDRHELRDIRTRDVHMAERDNASVSTDSRRGRAAGSLCVCRDEAES